MLPGVDAASSSSNNTSDQSGNLAPPTLASNQVRENQPTEEQNLQERYSMKNGTQGDNRHEPRRTRSRRRGRRRGRRRRRGQQRARARARARQEAQIAMAEISEDSTSTSEDGGVGVGVDEENFVRAEAASARSRSPRRQRSLDNDDLLRRGLAGTRPTPPRLQPSPCRVPNCEWTGPLEEAAQHARTAHNDGILEGPRQRLSVPLAFAAYTRYWRLIDAFDELFLVQFRRRAGSRRPLQAAVQLVGPASRAAQFLYLLHMQVVQSEDPTDPLSSTEAATNSSSPSQQSTTHISLVLGHTSSTRVNLEPAMISLWSAHNFSRLETSLENISRCLPILPTEGTANCANTSAPRILDLTLSIQQISGINE